MRSGVQDAASQWWVEGRRPREDGKDHRGKEVRQVYSEENDLCYLSTMPTQTLMCT